MFKIVVALFSMAYCSNLFACRGPFSEDYSLLDALPNAADKQEVVAKVRVLARTHHAANVVVIEAIKGVVLNERFRIETSGSSCSWLDARTRFFYQGASAAGATDSAGGYYIAGSWRSTPPQGGSKTFTGAWRGQTRIH